MKPKISTGYLTPQTKKTKNVAKSRLSNVEENASESDFDHDFFEALMKCPEKKKMILELLASNKDAIEKYKKTEAKSSVQSPVGKLKNKRAACESPTALLRRRALEQMNASPSVSNRSNSSRSELSRPGSSCSEISNDYSSSPIPFNKILDGVVAYVEIRNKDQDRSTGAKEILRTMGAKVKEKFSNDVTHVIFKDGSFMTYQKAKLMKIHLVSILWVEFCRKTMRRQPEKQYPALKSGFQDNETSMICSQMQKEYEDIIRDEYRRSIIQGTPLPSTRSLIDRRRTLMTPSISNLNSSTSFRTAAESISSQEMSDREVAAINGFKNSEVLGGESLILNDPDYFSEVSGPMVNGSTVEKRNTVSNYILKSVENIYCSDVELTEIDTSKSLSSKNVPHQQPAENDSDMELTIILDSEKTPKVKTSKSDLYDQKTPKLLAKKNPTALFDRRKTICNSLLSSDSSTTSFNNMSSLISSDKSTNVTNNGSFAIPKISKKSKRSSSSLFGSNESFEFGKNKAKSSKVSCPEVDNTASAISELNLSSDKNISKRSSVMSDLHVSSEKRMSEKSLARRSTSTSNLEISSAQKTKEKSSQKSTLMSDLRISSERLKSKDEKSVMSSLEVSSTAKDSIVSSENKKKSGDKSSMSPLQISTESKKLDSDRSVMSSLHISSEKEPKDSKSKQPKENMLLSNDPSFSSLDGSNSGPIKNIVEDVIKTLQTPDFVTVRKKSGSTSASVSKASVISDDSEILSPKKNVRRTMTRKSMRGKGNLNASSSSSDDEHSKEKQVEDFLVDNKKRISKSRGNRKTIDNEKVLVVNIVKPLNNNLQRDEDNSENEQPPSSVKTKKRTIGVKRLKKIDTFKNHSTRNDYVEKENPRKKNTENTSSNDSDKDLVGEAKDCFSSDSSKSKKKLRKLYNPDDSIHIEIDDEQEREQKRREVKKRKSDEGVFINPAAIVYSNPHVNNTSTQNESINLKSDSSEPSPTKRIKKGKIKETKRTILNSSADEQKELLNEVVNKKYIPEKTPKTPKITTRHTPESKSKSPKVQTPTKTPSRRKSTRIIKPTQKLIELRENSNSDSKFNIPITPINRRSTLDFVQSCPKSSSKKSKKMEKMKVSTIVCTKLHKSDVQVFTQIIKKLGRFSVEDEVSNRTTHLVAGEPKRTINMLRAISRGCWVLKFEWVLQSLEAGKWLREEDFEVIDFSPVVQKSRLERQAFGSRYTLDVFESCAPIYVATSTNPRSSDLKELISTCRGKVVTAHRMAKIIIGEYVKQEDTVCLNETWVLDCITFNKKMPFKKQYVLDKKTENARKSLVV